MDTITDYIASFLNISRDFIIDSQNLLYQHLYIYSFFMFWIGMCLASFTGVLVDRIPIINEWFSENKTSLSLNTRSACNHCKHKLNILSLIPIMGYMYYHGKCFNCKKSIPIIYPVMEILSGILCGIISFIYGPCENSLFLIVIYFLGLAIAWIDWNEGIIPDCLTLPLISIGLLYSPIENDILLKNEGMITGGFIFIVSFWLLGKYKQINLMAMGDVMLIAGIGSIIGQNNILTYLIVSAVFYIIYVLFCKHILKIKWEPNHKELLDNNELDFYPMGPSLCFSTLTFTIYLIYTKGI